MAEFSLLKRRGVGAEELDPRYEALLEGNLRPEQVDGTLRLLVDLTQEMRAPGDEAELTGQAAILAAYSRAFAPRRPSRRLARRLAAASPLLGLKLLGAGVAFAAAGTAAAAYTGSLPAPLQRAAHHTIGAPAPAVHPTPTHRPRTNGPAPTGAPGGASLTKGSAAYGLCTAYAGAGADHHSAAYAGLVRAADGAANVAAFCAGVPHPAAARPTAPPASHAHPTGPSSGHPTGRPTTLPSNRSSTAPSTPAHGGPNATPSHPSGAPTNHPTGPAQRSH